MSDMIDNSEFERCINASDLIDWMMCVFPDWCEGDVRHIMDHIDEMPSAQPEQRWILCDMQLPEKTQLCLVTEKTVVGFEVCTRCFNKRGDGGFWSGWGHTDVIAWMPLPEPYVERRQDE